MNERCTRNVEDAADGNENTDLTEGVLKQVKVHESPQRVVEEDPPLDVFDLKKIELSSEEENHHI